MGRHWYEEEASLYIYLSIHIYICIDRYRYVYIDRVNPERWGVTGTRGR